MCGGGVHWPLIPILISYNVSIKEIHRNSIIIDNPTRFCVQIGFGGTNDIPAKRGYLEIRKGGHIRFRGSAKIASGLSIRVNANELCIGNNFWINKNCHISCDAGIIIGDDFLGGWEVEFADSDAHYIIINKIKKIKQGCIEVGNHVWCASHVSIHKGATIGNDTIIGVRSLVLNKFDVNNVIIAGSPAKIVRNHIDWEL